MFNREILILVMREKLLKTAFTAKEQAMMKNIFCLNLEV